MLRLLVCAELRPWPLLPGTGTASEPAACLSYASSSPIPSPSPPWQVLSRDIRSVTQRVKVPQRAQQGGPAALSGAQQQEQQQGGTGEAEEGYWKVVLDGVEVTYDVEEGTRDVLLRSAHLAA